MKKIRLGEVERLLLFNRKTSQIVRFIIACKLYIRIRMKEIMLE